MTVLLSLNVPPCLSVPLPLLACLILHTHTHTHFLSPVRVAMLRSNELKTKISHAHSLILSLLTCLSV